MSVGHREAVLKHELVKQPTIQAQISESIGKLAIGKCYLSYFLHFLGQGLALRGHNEKEGNLMQYCYMLKTIPIYIIS